MCVSFSENGAKRVECETLNVHLTSEVVAAVGDVVGLDIV